MKPRSLILILIVGTALSLAQGQMGATTQVVRLLPDSKSKLWKMIRDRKSLPVAVDSAKLLTEIQRLNLKHGDLLIVGRYPPNRTDPSYNTWETLQKYCSANRVALYLWPLKGSRAEDQLFSPPVF